MEKESTGRFVACICKTENTHMPAVAIVRDDPGKEREVLIETIRTNYTTDDPMDAYRQALEDYKDALAGCNASDDLDQRIQCVISTLREKGYVLTPKTMQRLVFDNATPDTLH